MNIVLLSGGSGKRLWPLSNDIRSKQFIKLFRKDNGEYQSMVQRVFSQIRSVNPQARVLIATSKKQVSAIHHHVGDDVGICVEPCRRDTFPAIALSCAYLRDVCGVPEDEAVVVCPVDPYVDTAYFEAVEQLSHLVQEGTARLALMGIEPTYPSEKYGYILPQTADPISRVRMFREKPDAQKAAAYIAEGALWNGGVFAFRLGYLTQITEQMTPYTSYRDLYAHYEELPRISFDYAVVEKESDIAVMRFQGQWADLGTWNTLCEAMTEPTVGEAILSDTCRNVHVLNELKMPILCMGLQNVVVSASPEGILVSDKQESSYIKPYVDALDGEIMFAEKSWGSYQVLDVQRSSLTILVTLNAGHGMNYHSHRLRDEVWTVISGSGTAIVDGKRIPLTVGQVVRLPAGCRHTVTADTELKLIEVQLGDEISVHDKQKYEDTV